MSHVKQPINKEPIIVWESGLHNYVVVNMPIRGKGYGYGRRLLKTETNL